MNYQESPGIAQRLDRQTAEAERAWNNRFGEPISTSPSETQTSDTKNIHTKINERAAKNPSEGTKAVRGTGKGFWSDDARETRTASHVQNWVSNNPFTTESFKRGGLDGAGSQFPYEPSKLHKRRAETESPLVFNGQIHPEPGSAQVPAERPDA